MVEVSAQKDLEDARRELRQILDDRSGAIPTRVRARVRRALDLLESAAAKLGPGR
jgi:hypothetical protein